MDFGILYKDVLFLWLFVVYRWEGLKPSR